MLREILAHGLFRSLRVSFITRFFSLKNPSNHSSSKLWKSFKETISREIEQKQSNSRNIEQKKFRWNCFVIVWNICNRQSLGKFSNTRSLILPNVCSEKYIALTGESLLGRKMRQGELNRSEVNWLREWARRIRSKSTRVFFSPPNIYLLFYCTIPLALPALPQTCFQK